MCDQEVGDDESSTPSKRPKMAQPEVVAAALTLVSDSVRSLIGGELVADSSKPTVEISVEKLEGLSSKVCGSCFANASFFH